MRTTDDVGARLARAAARLAAVAAKRETAFEALKSKYGGPAADPNLWMRRFEEIAREVGEAVPDPWPELAADFDALADAWLAATPDARESMAASLAAHRSLLDGHLGYVAAARKSLDAATDARAIVRVAAVVAMGRGGADYRDAIVSVEEFVRAARAAGLDPRPEFERVAALASASDSFGYGRGSSREALLRFARAR